MRRDQSGRLRAPRHTTPALLMRLLGWFRSHALCNVTSIPPLASSLRGENCRLRARHVQRQPRPVRPRTSALLLLAAMPDRCLTTFFFQYVIGLQPCILVSGSVGPTPIVMVLDQFWSSPWPCALPGFRLRCWRSAVLALLFGEGRIAVFHVGVEQHWWTGTPGCGVQPPPIRSMLCGHRSSRPYFRCDQVWHRSCLESPSPAL